MAVESVTVPFTDPNGKAIIGQNAIDARIWGTYKNTYKNTDEVPAWFTEALKAGNGTFTSTSDNPKAQKAAKMLGGSNSWVVSKDKIVIKYKKDKKLDDKELTVPKPKSTEMAWVTLTEGKDWFVNGECYIFWCGVQQKWHMTGRDDLYYRVGTDETETDDVPEKGWYCCSGFEKNGIKPKTPIFAHGGFPDTSGEKTGKDGAIIERITGEKDDAFTERKNNIHNYYVKFDFQIKRESFASASKRLRLGQQHHRE